MSVEKGETPKLNRTSDVSSRLAAIGVDKHLAAGRPFSVPDTTPSVPPSSPTLSRRQRAISWAKSLLRR